jgi:hypothetical protein
MEHTVSGTSKPAKKTSHESQALLTVLSDCNELSLQQSYMLADFYKTIHNVSPVWQLQPAQPAQHPALPSPALHPAQPSHHHPRAHLERLPQQAPAK